MIVSPYSIVLALIVWMSDCQSFRFFHKFTTQKLCSRSRFCSTLNENLGLDSSCANDLDVIQSTDEKKDSIFFSMEAFRQCDQGIVQEILDRKVVYSDIKPQFTKPVVRPVRNYRKKNRSKRPVRFGVT